MYSGYIIYRLSPLDSPELVMHIEGCDRLETDRQTNTNSCHQVNMDTGNTNTNANLKKC